MATKLTNFNEHNKFFEYFFSVFSGVGIDPFSTRTSLPLRSLTVQPRVYKKIKKKVLIEVFIKLKGRTFRFFEFTNRITTIIMIENKGYRSKYVPVFTDFVKQGTLRSLKDCV